MKYGKLDLGQIEAIVNKLGGMDGVQRFLSDELIVITKGVTQQNNVLPIDYRMSLQQMIAAGNYDWVNGDITTQRFPHAQDGQTEITVELIHFDRTISSEDAIDELRHRGLRPATIAELLAYGARFPEEQRKFPIIALGSVAGLGGGRDVPSLDGCGGGRDLGLDWWDGGWGGDCRFLAVRN